MAGQVANAFCAVRPPGHHAESHRSMGFCLFNHVAVAAQHLIDRHGIKRVAIVDWDVHHGNGTQQIFEERPDVLYISLHEHPMHLYPGTGHVWEKGKHKGEGFTLNLPLEPGSGDATYRNAVTEIVEPAVDMFRPEFLLISAGFDAARGDPLAHMEVSPQGFQWMTRRMKALAEKHGGGKLVSTLEGGYDLRNLAECVALHTSSLMQAEGQDELMAMKVGV
jgi:acetoin utilization deacetylase AcuC-like enzyme